ncbi:MAG: LysR family transcriptional regulator [Armatimonadota bacterium]
MDFEILDIKDCAILCGLRRYGSISQVANHIGVSQPAVSQRITALESRLGFRVLDRGPGRSGQQLNAHGMVLEDAARRILGILDDLPNALFGASSDLVGRLQVATVYSLGLHSLAEPIRRFLNEAPNVEFDIEYMRTDRVYESVLSGESDVGIVACPKEVKGIRVLEWVNEPLALVMSPAFALPKQVQGLSVDDLAGIPFIAFADGIPTRLLIERSLQKVGVKLDVRKSYDNIETLKRTVELGFGVSLLPRKTVLNEISDGTLLEVPIQGFSISRACGILILEKKTISRASQKWLDLLDANRQG